MNAREELLEEAKKIITGDRNVQYGEPTADFQRTADLLNALEFRVSGKPLEPHHVAVIGMALKLSRMTWSPGKFDHWLDVAGYAACGWECSKAQHEDKAEEKVGFSQKVYIDAQHGWVEHFYSVGGRYLRTEKLGSIAGLNVSLDS